MTANRRALSTLTITLLATLALVITACGESDDADTNRDDHTAAAASFTVDIDGAASTLDVTEGHTVEVAFVLENTSDDHATANVEFTVGGLSDSMAIDLGSGGAASGSFSWTTRAGDAGSYTAQIMVGANSATANVTVREDDDNGGGGTGGGGTGDDNQGDGAFFDITIDPTDSTLEVTEGSPLQIMVLAVNTGDDAGVLEITGRVEIEGGGLANLELQSQEGDANTPIPPGQAAQVQLELPTGPTDQELSAGQHTLTINSPHDSDSVTLVVNEAT